VAARRPTIAARDPSQISTAAHFDGTLENVQFDVIKDVKDPWKEAHPE
jgi:hypothetical protein